MNAEHALEFRPMGQNIRSSDQALRRWICVLVGSIMVFGMAGAMAKALEQYRWSYRPLIIATHAAGAFLSDQLAVIDARKDGFKERDVVVIVIEGETVTTRLGPKIASNAADLRTAFGLKTEEFAVLLVGKDGGLKLASERPVSAKELFALIDSMPMRRREMRQ